MPTDQTLIIQAISIAGAGITAVTFIDRRISSAFNRLSERIDTMEQRYDKLRKDYVTNRECVRTTVMQDDRIQRIENQVQQLMERFRLLEN
jgi:hypothetical protein